MAAIQQMLFIGAPPDFVELTNRLVFHGVIAPDSAYAGIFFATDGTLYRKQGLGTVQISGEWATQIVAGGDYEIRAALSSGSAPSGPALNTWHGLGVAREWGVTQAGIGTTTSVLVIEIRLAATGEIQGSATLTLEATVEI